MPCKAAHCLMGKSKRGTRAAGYDSDKELAKKRKVVVTIARRSNITDIETVKNAEAQADFRKRRTQYVVELETSKSIAF